MTKTVIAVVISASLGDISLELDKEKARVQLKILLILLNLDTTMRLSFIE